MELKDHIRGIPDFPKPGILFYDISTLIAHTGAWKKTIDDLAELVDVFQPEMLAGIEARGFLVAAPLAVKLSCGLLMVRKEGKLPGETISHKYDLEYGTDTLQVQADAAKPGTRVVLIDDLLATSGTMCAAAELLEKLDANVTGAATIIELTFLNGQEQLKVPFSSLLKYDE